MPVDFIILLDCAMITMTTYGISIGVPRWAVGCTAGVSSSLSGRCWTNGLKQLHTHRGLRGVVRSLEIATDKKSLSLEFQDRVPTTQCG